MAVNQITSTGYEPVSRSRTHHKAEALLEVDVTDAAISFEESLHIFLPGGGAQAANENTTPAHPFCTN